MTEMPTIAESAALVIFSAKLGLAVSVMNLVGSALLIYGAIQLRKGTKVLQEWQARLLAQAGVSRMGGDAEGGSGEPKAN